ncbi:MAG: ribonuclease III [Ilumatobacteraceae bacterium]|nr:ribonuclease III [Ilumatobacteraceae bacterium]
MQSDKAKDDALLLLSTSIGHEFSDISLLRTALVHRSWLAETQETISNERLEFLGDAVLGWAIADIAYHRLDDCSEGKLSDLRQAVVNAIALADIARSLNLGDYLFLGKGEDSAGGRNKTSILSDCFEAVIGAVYLDAGADTASRFVRRHLLDRIEEVIPNLDTFDHKTRLQEIAARQSLGVPVYRTSGVGPEHDKVFTSVVLISGAAAGAGTGKNKKSAEQEAARHAFEDLMAKPGA